MLRLSRKVEYALISVLHLAELPPEEPTPARALAERYHIPSEILGKVLQALTRAGLVESVQGAHGGYRLRQPLDKVYLGQLIEAVDGPVHVAACTCDDYACQQDDACNIKQPIVRLQDQLMRFVYGVSLAALRANGQMPIDLNSLPLEERTDHVLLEKEI